MRFLALPLLSLLLLVSAHAQTFTYSLSSNSYVEPSDDLTATGPSEALTGTFSLTYIPASSSGHSVAFEVTALDLHSASYSFTEPSGPYPLSTADNSVYTFLFFADANATGSLSGSKIIGGQGVYGSYASSPIAPSNLFLSQLGVAPISGGTFSALIGITAVQTPEPPVTALLAGGLFVLACFCCRVGKRLPLFSGLTFGR